jgi:1,4-dihydroxy-2-naphthoate octaprenyltransferase
MTGHDEEAGSAGPGNDGGAAGTGSPSDSEAGTLQVSDETMVAAARPEETAGNESEAARPPARAGREPEAATAPPDAGSESEAAKPLADAGSEFEAADPPTDAESEPFGGSVAPSGASAIPVADDPPEGRPLESLGLTAGIGEDVRDGDAEDREPGGDGRRPPFRQIRQEFGKPSWRPTLKAWWQASRPSFYIATLYPLFLGLAASRTYGEGSPSAPVFVLILIASFLVHLATNIANDYFEHSGGVDTPGSLGGSRVIQEGKLSPQAIKRGIIFCYAAAFLLAIIIVGRNWPLWCLVAFAALSSVFYVAPPVKYGHRALGELMVFLNMGVIMTAGTFMALTGELQREVLALSLPGGFMVANILYYQSLPEIAADADSGKRTIAGLLGKERAALVQLLWWPLIWLLVLTLVLSGELSVLALLCLLAVPFHAISMRRIWKAKDWIPLDSSGWLIKLLYVWTGLAILAGACHDPFQSVAAPPPAITAPARHLQSSVPAAPTPAPAIQTAPQVAQPTAPTAQTSTPAVQAPAPAAQEAPVPATQAPAPATPPATLAAPPAARASVGPGPPMAAPQASPVPQPITLPPGAPQTQPQAAQPAQ